MASSVPMLMAPADSPKTVIFPGSPPNAAILSRTHCRAATWSSRPQLLEKPLFSPPLPATCRKPSAPTLQFRETTTTSPLTAKEVLSNQDIEFDPQIKAHT